MIDIKILSAAKNPVLWYSGGTDSTLLLNALLGTGIPFDIVQIRNLWTKEQKLDSLIIKRNLKVFSFDPSAVYFIGDDETSVVFEYAFSGGELPLIIDLGDGRSCGLDALSKIGRGRIPVNWDLHIVGSRRDDTHYALKNLVPSEVWKAGGTTFYAPLYHWTREQVLARQPEITADTGVANHCFNCVKNCGLTFCPKEGKEILAVNWDRAAMTQSFRNKYYG